MLSVRPFCFAKDFSADFVVAGKTIEVGELEELAQQRNQRLTLRRRQLVPPGTQRPPRELLVIQQRIEGLSELHLL